MTEVGFLKTEGGSVEKRLKISGKITDFESLDLSGVEWDSSRYMFKRVLNTIPQPVFWKDRDFVYQGCNAAFSAETGCSQQDIIGKTDFDSVSDRWLCPV